MYFSAAKPKSNRKKKDGNSQLILLATYLMNKLSDKKQAEVLVKLIKSKIL